MANTEEHVDFVPKPGVTVYLPHGRFDHDPDRPIRLSKAQAEAWEAHRHKPEKAEASESARGRKAPVQDQAAQSVS